MLPALDPQSPLEDQYQQFLQDLTQSVFSGEIESSYASRLAVATDNSIYQQIPQAVVFPKGIEDLQVLGQTVAKYHEVKFSARGGGTGTNGQSLTSGIIVDMSRHMNKVLEVNEKERWAKVQSGVVKDQLNDVLRPLGFFFAPDLSTSNRATIGGMINTDASGQGSLVYGKTSDHVLELTSVLVDGSVIQTSSMPIDEAKALAKSDSKLGKITQQVMQSCLDKREQVLATFPRLNRFLTGYDLENTFDPQLSHFDLSRVITGSEGSLAFVAEAKVNITPIANFKALVNVKYDSFESALRHAPSMVAAQATSVETVDSNVLNLAKQDIIWHSVKDLITEVEGKAVLGLNMVEYNSNDQADIEQKIAKLTANLTQAQDQGVIGFQITYEKSAIQKIYAMRKKSVGLLGKTKGRQKPIAFVEDTAVPPENLADFIMEFRALLDSHGLHYGMFGHVDAGVLHVRPALDMCEPSDEAKVPDISEQVVALVAKYGGLMWGEHGKGYRSEYGPQFFGDELFNELRKIKTVFDPENKMNPGKICTPIDSTGTLVKVTGQTRGQFDRQIPIAVRDAFEPAMSCNGNGLCFNYEQSSVMCPSFKVTGDRRHSPKGRAGMMREWLRLLANNNIDVNELAHNQDPPTWFERLRNSTDKAQANDFSHQVLEVMQGCLACKACASQCPVSVDVPSFRARFLSIYYQRYMRPAKDILVANIEHMAPLMAKVPGLVNFFLRKNWVNAFIEKTVGYIDSPILSEPRLTKRLSGSSAIHFDLAKLRNMSQQARSKTICIVQDPFTSFYEAPVVEALIQLITKLGYQPVLLPFMPNGKPQHVKGFLKEFAKTAQSAADFLNQLDALAIGLIGIDPSMVLCYRDEYNKALGKSRGEFQVQLVHEWLLSVDLPKVKKPAASDYVLFGHCSEKTALPESEQQWQDIFQQAGLGLSTVSVGCCGMAGTFGHEASHIEESKALYQMSWQQAINRYAPDKIVATGYSCRSQVARFENKKPRHPLQVLAEAY